MSANITPTGLADAAWKQVFSEGPYTAFIMYDYLRVQANIADWSALLETEFNKNNGFPAFRQLKAKRTALAQDSESLRQIWASQPGRCTSFAVKVISMLESQWPRTFKFNIYDIGHHRVARCEKTGILIDSSALEGAFPLPEGQWFRMEGSDASWKWVKGKSKFERQVGRPGNQRLELNESKTIISKEVALVTCLLELPKANSIPTLFRSIDPTTKKAVYHAMVKWQWMEQSLVVLPTLDHENMEFSCVVKFGGGTDATNVQCLTHLLGFIQNYGGPHHEQQWALVSDINLSIWAGAVEAWGKPQWIYVPVKRPEQTSKVKTR